MLAGRGPIGSKTISYLTLTIKERCLRVIFHNSKVVALQQEMLTYEVLITPSPLQLSPLPLLPLVTQCGPANTEHPSTVPPESWTPSNSNLLFNLKIIVSQETRFIWVYINKLSAIVRVVRRSAQRVYSPGFLRRCCGHQALSSGQHQSEMPEMSNKTIHQQSILDRALQFWRDHGTWVNGPLLEALEPICVWCR